MSLLVDEGTMEYNMTILMPYSLGEAQRYIQRVGLKSAHGGFRTCIVPEARALQWHAIGNYRILVYNVD